MRICRRQTVARGIAAALTATAVSAAFAGVTQLVSVTSSLQQGSDESRFPVLSADGRVVAFVSRAEDLVADDDNSQPDIFVHIRPTRQTYRVNLSSSGEQAEGFSADAAISADGRHVAFSSSAANLVPDDHNMLTDVFVRDLESGTTTRVSLGPLGLEADGFSVRPSLSQDGRFVAFESVATNLVPLDENQVRDVFVHDRTTGITERISVGPGGIEANGPSDSAVISADGRYVAFRSDATNLVPDDDNETSDVFVRDRLLGITTRVSVNSQGQEGNGDSRYPAISADGRYVSFTSIASNLVDADENEVTDIFVHDRQTGVTVRVSVGPQGLEANDFSFRPSISADGCKIAFESQATNLVADDTNERTDIFVHDRCLGETVRVSRSATGQQAGDHSFFPSISADGRVVAFDSFADDLVSQDGNERVDVFVRDARPVCDFDDDGDVDADDLAHLLACRSRSNVAQESPACASADLDGDTDVDMDDFGRFQRCFAGSGVIADPECEG